MKKVLLQPDTLSLPASFSGLLKHPVYDSSCSAEARVYFIDADGGLYLKTAADGTLAREAEMTRFLNKKGLAAQVLAYEKLDRDWLLTSAVPGEDCTHSMYRSDPTRLCDATAELLRQLHSTDITGCPVSNRTSEYLARARRSYETKAYDISLFPDNWGYRTPEEAWRVVEENGKYLESNTLIHGDYCLPNIMLDNWRFTGFVDVGNGGVGDRHVDLFWGIWSLWFNLKTDALRDRFLDVYGRSDVNEELLRVVAAIEVFT